MKERFIRGFYALLAAVLILGSLSTSDALAQGDSETPPAAQIVNDEGGAVRISGSVTYSAPYFTLGVAQPLVILEDQAGFVDRNEHFLMPVASQTIGQITSDFLHLPSSIRSPSPSNHRAVTATSTMMTLKTRACRFSPSLTGTIPLAIPFLRSGISTVAAGRQPMLRPASATIRDGPGDRRRRLPRLHDR